MSYIRFVYFICLVSILGACQHRAVVPESQTLVGEWRFTSVKQGATLALCQEDISGAFEDKILVFTPEVVYIKDAKNQHILLSGTWEAFTATTYFGDDVNYQYELTTRFPTALQNHSYDWTKIPIREGGKHLDLESCHAGKCFKYNFERIR